MTAPAPWYFTKARGREGAYTLRAWVDASGVADETKSAKQFDTPAIPSPALVDAVHRHGHAEAWLSPDGYQWRVAALDRAQGYEPEALAAADEAGETITVIAIWKN